MRDVTFEIPIGADEPLGAIPDRKLIIVQVQASTLADGRIKVGDRVTKIGDIRVRDLHHFNQLLLYAPTLLRLTVQRDEDDEAAARRASTDLELSAIPEERRRFIPLRAGFSYQVVELEMKQGEMLSLRLFSYQNRVLVSATGPNSVSARHLKRGDHLIDVNGARVSDKQVASQFINKSLNSPSRKVSLLVARPSTPATKAEMEEDLVRKMAPPSVLMPSDVKEICARQRERMRVEHQVPLPSIVTVPNSRLPQAVTFDGARNKQVSIPNDKTLRPVDG